MPIIRAIVLSVIGLILVKNPEKLWKLECALGWKYGEVKNGYLNRFAINRPKNTAIAVVRKIKK